MVDRHDEHASIELCELATDSGCAEGASVIIQIASETGTASEPFSRNVNSNSSADYFGLPGYVAQRRGIRGFIRRFLWRHGYFIARMYVTIWVAVIIVIILSVLCSIMGEGEQIVKSIFKSSSSANNSSTDFKLDNNFF
ncbi:hypothetical protein HNY73_014043 [Argiope bruennichi]|uniref:Uncharacterized protein n=1 Tax=Argiope bruennichi TaxID=94029 RepID=A0A8T0EMN6_ARGBR|nr:hypothetical protein HNY73_014043 [Argiope bruennichi]